jgi:hypothetical protein
MALTLDDLFTSPDHYLHALDGDAAVFVPMDRAAYQRSIFLDARISPSADGSMRVPLAMLAGNVPPPRPTGWIFHVAHCGSTLLARALDQTSSNLVLREPLALRQLAVAPDKKLLPIVAAMLGKRYRPDAPTIVKANVPVNFLLPDLGSLDRDAPAIFLHLPLRDYLLAILRSDDHRAWLRRVTKQLAPHLGLLPHADGELAAALWLAQMRAYAAAIGRLPNARSLNAETFFSEPRGVLQAVAANLHVSMSPTDVDAVVGGPLFATYSKNPSVQFDNAARLARRRDTEAALRDDLSLAERWMSRSGDGETATAALAAAALIA